MSNIALITQPLRAVYCLAHIEEGSDRPWIVLTGDPSPFPTDGLPDGTSIHQIHFRPDAAHVTERAVVNLRRRVADWAKSGSVTGALVGKAVRRLLRVLRGRKAPIGALTFQPITASGQLESYEADPRYQRMARSAAESPIGEIVVFDLYDLPVALAFGNKNDVPVIVR